MVLFSVKERIDCRVQLRGNALARYVFHEMYIRDGKASVVRDGMLTNYCNLHLAEIEVAFQTFTLGLMKP